MTATCPESRRQVRERIEAESFGPEDGERLYRDLPGAGAVRPAFDDAGEIVLAVRDAEEPREESGESTDSSPIGKAEIVTLFRVAMELGRWAGGNPLRQYAAKVVTGLEVPDVPDFAKANRVAATSVYREIRGAKKQLTLSQSHAHE